MDRPSELERRMIGEAPGLRVQQEENGRTVIQGYAALVRSESQDLGGFIETIAPGAFDAVMRSNPDVFGRYNHERLLGRTSSGTMKLELDERGLKYTIYPKHSDADVVESISRGDIRGSSFAFRSDPSTEQWTRDKAGRMIREIRNITHLADAGPVDNPAYPETEAYVSKRALEMALAEPIAEPREAPEEPIREPQTPEAPESPVQELDVEPTEIDEPAEHPVLAEPPSDSAAEENEEREVGMKPTAGMASAAKRGLELHEKGLSGDGLKPETVARANRLARREEMNRDWIVEMNAWFKRHESSKTDGWDEPPDYSPAFVAWLLWGGNSGRDYSARKVAEIEREEQSKRALDVAVNMRAAVAISKLRNHLHG